MTTNSIPSVLESYLQLRSALSSLRTRETKETEFGPNQITVLYRLTLSDATMGELVEYAFTDKASMTRTISTLVKMGLVRRKRDPKDGRVIRIQLSAKGKEKAQAAKKVRTGIGKKLDESLSPEDRKTFCALIEKLIHKLNSN
jgi:DNA-binding MarR family transcriptional regulator